MGTTFCPFCGEPQPQEDTGNTPEKKKRNQRSAPIVEPKPRSGIPKPSTDAILIRREDDDDEPIILPEDEEKAKEQGGQRRKEVGIIPQTVIPINPKGTAKDMGTVPVEETVKTENEGIEVKGNIFSKKIREAEAEKKRIYAETHDERTGCLNDQAYLEKMQEGATSERCVIAVDATGYINTINKSGQDTGNLYLKCVGESLQQVFGEDNSYFLGGEEFRVLLFSIKEAEVTDRVKLFYRLLDKKSREQPMHINMLVALGIAFSEPNEEAASLEERASESMTANTQQVKNTYRPNDDGYYDDIKVEYEKLKKQYVKKDINAVVKNLILILLGTIVLVVLRMLI